MQISRDLTFWLKSEGSTGQLKLETGEMVKALVKDVTSEQVVLLIRGQSITAKTETDLIPGQRVQLKVQDNIDGKIVFQMVEGKEDAAAQGFFGRVSAESFLTRFGLSLTENNILMAQALLETGTQGISKEEIQFLARLLGNNANKNDALALVQLYQKGLPLKNSHVLSLANFFQVFNTSDQDGLLFNSQLDKMLALLERGNELSQKLVFSSKDGQNMGQKLRELPARLGLEYEANIQKGDLNNISSITKNMPSAKEALLLLSQGQELPVVPSPELLETARFLLQSLTGLQLMNLGQTEEMRLYLMGWLGFDEINKEQNPFFLSFFQNKGEGQGPGDPAHQIMIKTSTPRLGSILSEIRFFGNKVSVEVTVDNAVTQKVFNEYQDKLAEMMSDLPWKVRILPCRLEEKTGTQQSWLQEYIEPSIPQNIDIRL